MIKWPKEASDDFKKKITEKLGDKLKEFEEKHKLIYVFEYNDTIYIFKMLTLLEWNNLLERIPQSDSVALVEEAINQEVCKTCVLYNYDKLEFLPGLVQGIANIILRDAGFEALGSGRAIDF